MAGCSTCASGCGPGSVDEDLDRMVLNCISNLRKPLDESQEEISDLEFNKIGFLMASNQITSIKPLVAVFDARGPRGFLTLIAHLLHLNIRGSLICWAWVFCDEDVEVFVRRTCSHDVALIEHVNREAAIFECFNRNSSQPRARLPIQSSHLLAALSRNSQNASSLNLQRAGLKTTSIELQSSALPIEDSTKTKFVVQVARLSTLNRLVTFVGDSLQYVWFKQRMLALLIVLVLVWLWRKL